MWKLVYFKIYNNLPYTLSLYKEIQSMKKVVHTKAMDVIEDEHQPEHSELLERISQLETERNQYQLELEEFKSIYNESPLWLSLP